MMEEKDDEEIKMEKKVKKRMKKEKMEKDVLRKRWWKKKWWRNKDRKRDNGRKRYLKKIVDGKKWGKNEAKEEKEKGENEVILEVGKKWGKKEIKSQLKKKSGKWKQRWVSKKNINGKTIKWNEGKGENWKENVR